MFLRSFILIAILPIAALADTDISDQQAAQHLGEKVRVHGTVVRVHRTSGGVTYLDFGAPYPAQTLTGWIPADSELATEEHLTELRGKRVRLDGTVQLFRGKPEIKLMARSALIVE
jgi:DNA/RNA endonuclease YhcR with UshA esterase domain